jgi:diguanylate cyclase (GGDEF)-like protein
MQDELPFDGFHELVRAPLEQSDPQSVKRIRRLFQVLPAPHPQPFSYIVKHLADKVYANQEALGHWKRLLPHKQELQSKLGRLVSIKTAAVDYFSLIEEGSQSGRSTPRGGRSAAIGTDKSAQYEEWMRRIYAPGYHLERLKDEIMRAKRYNHALSAIMLDIDKFHEIDEGVSEEARDAFLRIITRIIRSTVRAVDIIARYGDDVFLIILPSTNKREAMELSERLRQQVFERTKQVDTFPGGVTATLSVGQVSQSDSASAFIHSLEAALTRGKAEEPNTVYAL